MDDDTLVGRLSRELSRICGIASSPSYSRIVHEKRATVLVRTHHDKTTGRHIIDASESPMPGELPATIELAVISGEKAALQVLSWDKNHKN
jgi:hypothetical protein